MSEEQNNNNKSEHDSDSQKSKKKSHKDKERGEYKVVFKGRFLDGYSKSDIIANIVRLTKLPRDKIEKKFFSGKAVIIRRAHDQTHAQKLQQLFSNAGLEVVILKDTSQKQQDEVNIPKEKTKKFIIQKELKKTVTTRKRPVLAAVLWIVLIGIGINLWNEYNINVEVPESIVEIEQALANESLVFLAHVNIERLLSLHQYFVNDPSALPGVKSSFYNNLKKAGIDPQQSIKQMLTTSYVNNKKLVTHSILIGQFPVQLVKRFLLKHHYGQVIPEPDFVRVRIAELDSVSCQPHNFKEVAIESDRILISSEGHLDDLRRLLRKKPGNVTDLSQWSNYRSDKLASMAVFKPDEGAQFTSGLEAMMVQGVMKKNKSLESIYASVGMQLLPPGALVNVSLNSTEQAWIESSLSEFEKQIEEMKSKSQGLDNLQILLAKVSVLENNAQLSLTLQLDEELKRSIEAAIQELAEQFLTMDPPVSKPLTADTAAEKIDTMAVEFLPSYQADKLSSFDEQFDQLFNPAWIEGPFAVAIDELLLEQDQIVLQMRAIGQNIKNMGSQQAKITVLSVNDKNDNNVLDKQKCGKPANQDDGYFSQWGGIKTAYVNNQPVQYTELEARKKVKLKPGVKFSEVKSLQAMIDLNLATQVKIERFARPEQNQVLSAFDTRLFFKPTASNMLSYTVSGDEKRILAVRALNQDNQYLSRSSSSSMGSLWGAGRTVTQNYQGQVAFVEVVYAKEINKLSYPVEIKKFPPYYSDNNWKYELETVKTTSIEQWNERYQNVPALEMTQNNNWQGKAQARWQSGPFNLALYGLKSSKHWGTTGQLMIKTPIMNELRYNLSALEFYFRYPESSDNGELGQSYYHQLKAKGYYMNGEFIPDLNKPYMEGQLSFTLPMKEGQAPLKQVNGDIIVHLPVAKHSSYYSDISIGAQWEDVGVTTKIVRMGNDVMELEVSGNRDRLLQVILLNAENQRISTSDIEYAFNSGSQEQQANIVLNYHGIPVKAQLTVSEGQQTRRYPFQLKLE